MFVFATRPATTSYISSRPSVAFWRSERSGSPLVDGWRRSLDMMCRIS